MAVIDINEFGGVLPSVKARDLTDTFAQVATNLDQRFLDFRPTKTIGSSLTTVAAAAKSVFRTPINGNWLDSTSDVDYVPNMVQDLTTERVYLTGRSAYPEAWEGGLYRRLGVVAPTVAPSFTFEEVYQFTAENASTFRDATIAAVQKAIEDSLDSDIAGFEGETPLALNDGAYWLPHGTVTSPVLPTNSSRMGSFCVPVTGSGGSYTVNSPKHLFVVNPALNGKVVSYLAQNYLAIPIYSNGSVYAFDSAGFTTAMQAIQNPQETAQFFPNVGIANVSDSYVTKFATTSSPQAEMIADLNNLLEQATRFLNPPSDAMLKEQIIEFYADMLASGGAIDKAADNLANSIYEVAAAVWATAVDSPFINSPIPSDVTPFVEPT